MKRTSRLTAMLLAVAMVFALAGCQKKEPPPGPDAMAQVLFDSMLKNDASSAVELLGYPSEEAARKDMGLDGDIYEEAAEQIVSQLEQMGLQVGDDGHYNYDRPVKQPEWTDSYRYRYTWE